MEVLNVKEPLKRLKYYIQRDVEKTQPSFTVIDRKKLRNGFFTVQLSHEN